MIYSDLHIKIVLKIVVVIGITFINLNNYFFNNYFQILTTKGNYVRPINTHTSKIIEKHVIRFHIHQQH